MSMMWASPGREQVMDAVTRTVPQQPVQPFGVQPTFYPTFGVPPTPYPLFGVPPTPYPTFGVPPTPYPPFGYQPFSPMYGVHPMAQALFGMPQIAPTFGAQPTAIPAIGPLMSPISPLMHPLAQAMLNLQPLTSTFGIQPTQIPGVGPLGGLIGLQEPLLAAMMGSVPSPIPGLIPSAAPIPTPWLHAALAPGLGAQHLHIPGLAHQATVAAPVSFLLSQLSLREAASKMTDDAMKERFIASINESTNRFIDDLAGVTLHPWFKAGPGAVPWVYPVVTELALTAHHFPEGSVRNEILRIASQILQKSLAPTISEGGEGGRRR